MGIAVNTTPQILGLAPDASIDILGTEVTQAIQNLKNDVPLVRGKPTLVRVYIKPNKFDRRTSIHGEIAVSPSTTSPAKYVGSMSSVVVSAAPYPDLQSQRRDIGGSLNFLLPPEAAGWSNLSVTVNRIISPNGNIRLSAKQMISLPTTVAPPLRIKAIGLSYLLTNVGAPPITVAPDAFHFDFLRSYLGRAYPISSIAWSQIVIQADPQFAPPFSGPLNADGDDPVWLEKLRMAHNQLSTLRAKDVEAGTDPRTHYYGLVSDANNGLFFRGAAKDIPEMPNPAVVAVGPVGDPQQYPPFSWDKDRSFAGWYGAHELGHTFGRSHPGFCDQDASDPAFPTADGRIGDNANGNMVGLDMGDPALSLPMKPMANETCHDIMTYCDNQWISAYTYQAILKRLIDENVVFRPIARA